MPSATGSSAYLAIVKQTPSAPHDVPVNPTLQGVPFSNISLGLKASTTKSKNVSGSRRTTDLIRTGFSVEGSLTAGMSYAASLDDELMLAALACDAWVSDVAVDGKFYQPFFMEVGYTDIAVYEGFVGVVVNKMTIKVSDGDIVEHSFDFIGLAKTVDTTAIGDVYNVPSNHPEFSSTTDITGVKIDGVESAECDIKEWTLEFNNNYTPKTGAGTMGACSTNMHKFDCSGKLTAYFTNSNLKNKLMNGTSFTFEFSIVDSEGNGYKFFIPNAKIEAEESPVDGDSDIIEDASFVALQKNDKCVEVTRIHP